MSARTADLVGAVTLPGGRGVSGEAVERPAGGTGRSRAARRPRQPHAHAALARRGDPDGHARLVRRPVRRHLRPCAGHGLVTIAWTLSMYPSLEAEVAGVVARTLRRVVGVSLDHGQTTAQSGGWLRFVVAHHSLAITRCGSVASTTCASTAPRSTSARDGAGRSSRSSGTSMTSGRRQVHGPPGEWSGGRRPPPQWRLEGSAPVSESLHPEHVRRATQLSGPSASTSQTPARAHARAALARPHRQTLPVSPSETKWSIAVLSGPDRA